MGGGLPSCLGSGLVRVHAPRMGGCRYSGRSTNAYDRRGLDHHGDSYVAARRRNLEVCFRSSEVGAESLAACICSDVGDLDSGDGDLVHAAVVFSADHCCGLSYQSDCHARSVGCRHLDPWRRSGKNAQQGARANAHGRHASC